MTDNPFKNLGQRLFPAEKNTRSPASRPHPGHAPAKPQAGEDDDTALFLRAMERTLPTSRKEKKSVSRGSEHSGPQLPVLPAGTDAGSPDALLGAALGRSAAAAPGLPLDADAEPEKEPSAPRREKPPAEAEDDTLFQKAMQEVRPLTARGRDVAPCPEEKRQLPGTNDPARALRELLEGRVEFAIQLTDEYLEGFVTGVDPLVLGKLRAGQLSPEAHIDLHGQNAVQAFDSLLWFIKNAYQRNMRTVLVITGRGKNSPDGVGILRRELQHWLTREPFKRVVLAFCTAQGFDGGPGAVYVLLRKYRKSRGKIIWERAAGQEEP